MRHVRWPRENGRASCAECAAQTGRLRRHPCRGSAAAPAFLQSPAGTVTRNRNVARKRTKASAAGAPVTTVVVMCLYVAGKAPNSVKAIANLEAICRRYLTDSYKLEIVDVCEHPQRALAGGFLVTPTLAKLSPAPTSHVIGNLSDTHNLLAALGL